MHTVIRPALIEDASAIAVLLSDLGYGASTEQINFRLARLLPLSDHAIFVAETAERIAGMCHVCGARNLASDGYAEMMEIVVAQAFQRKGIGKLLLREAEQWAASSAYPRMRLRSGAHREDVHLFYAFELFL